MQLRGKRIAILVEDQYEDLELWYPALRFREAGAEVTLLGPRKAAFHSKHGYPAEADVPVDDVRAESFDAVIIPGGYAPDRMRRSRRLVEFVRDAHRREKVIAAICHGGWMLVSADVLRGRKATAFFSIRDDMVNAGAEFVDEEVVRDGNLVTSRVPKDLPAFCRTIIQALIGVSEKAGVAE